MREPPSAAFEIKNACMRRGARADGFELRIPAMRIARGARVAFLGPSGCGKSTLLELLSLIGRASTLDSFRFGTVDGQVLELSQALTSGAADLLAAVRGRNIGCVVQTGALLAFATVRRNISISRDLLRMPEDGTVARLAVLLQIERHLGKKPGSLSVGERQRVAIARALAHRPQVLIADEPTAALDGTNADRVMEMLVTLGEKYGVTTVLATHDGARSERFGLQIVPLQPGIDPLDGRPVTICAC